MAFRYRVSSLIYTSELPDDCGERINSEESSQEQRMQRPSWPPNRVHLLGCNGWSLFNVTNQWIESIEQTVMHMVSRQLHRGAGSYSARQGVNPGLMVKYRKIRYGIYLSRSGAPEIRVFLETHDNQEGYCILAVKVTYKLVS